MSGKTGSRKSKNQNKIAKRSNRSNKNRNGKKGGIPAARTFSAKPHAKSSRVGQSMSIKVREIFPLQKKDSGLSFMLPICPTKWTNTRSCVLASAYMSHRPLSLQVQYEPSVGTTTNGSLAFGTVFAGSRLPTDGAWPTTSVSLAASPGGFICTVWDKKRTKIPLGKNLTQNQYPTYQVSSDDIPLWICVATNSPAVDLGFIIVDAVFTMRNPIAASLSPPISGSGDAEFEHNEETNKTKLKFPVASLNRAITAGQDFILASSKPLKSVAGGVLSQILSPFIAKSTGTEGTNAIFEVDQQYATQQALLTLIGQAENF